MKKQVCIVGAGGCAQSAYLMIESMGYGDEIVAFLESESHYQPRSLYGLQVKPLSFFQPECQQALLALGTPQARAEMQKLLPATTQYASYIHPQAFLLSPETLTLRPGALIYPQSYLAREITLGSHAILMAGTVLGHNLEIGDFFTASAHVALGGHVKLGSRIFCGLQSAIRDHLTVCDDVILSMGTILTRDIHTPGVYGGNPARLMRTLQAGQNPGLFV